MEHQLKLFEPKALMGRVQPTLLQTDPYRSVNSIGTAMKAVHRRDGKVIWASLVGEFEKPLSDDEYFTRVEPKQPWHHNYLADGGENSMLDVYFRAATAPSHYLGLVTADPGETGTPATMSEITGSGYARIQINRNNTDWPTLALNGGDYMVTSVGKVFTATGGWSAATHMVVVTSASGTTGALVLVNPLSATRTLVNTDTLTITNAVKQA